MSQTGATFDTLEYARKLEKVGFTREQADTQAGAFRAFTESQKEELRQKLATRGDIDQLAASTKSDIAQLAASTRGDIDQLAASTKSDIAELAASTKTDIAQLAASTKTDIAQLDARIKELELKLQKEMRESEIRLLKWQIGGWVALAAIMAKGFNWIGF